MGDALAKVKGSCLCKDVQYTVEGDPIYSVICHCDNCRLSTGSQFNAASVYMKMQFKIMSDKSLKEYKDYETDSKQALSRYFCSNCGSSCFAMTPIAEEIVSVFSGSLENAMSWKPTKEQYLETKSHWAPDFGISDKRIRGPFSDAPA